MPSAKTSTVTFRIAPTIKEALREVAEREHRSLANMVEVMIRDYCRQSDVEIPAQQGTFARGSRGSQGKRGRTTNIVWRRMVQTTS